MRLYAVLRADITMTAGKAAAQAGHAYVEAHLAAQRQTPATAEAYRLDPPGTKVCLVARRLDDLLEARDLAEDAGLPHALITDRGHLHPPDFDGSPIVTALGLGPATRRDAARILRRFQLA